MKNVTQIKCDDDSSAAMSLARGPALARDLDPEWDHARELLAQGRATARALVVEIERLRAQYLGEGRTKTRSEYTQSVKSRFSQSVKNQSQGFVAKIREELDLHPQQAQRLQEAASYEMRIETLAISQPGEQITWHDKDGQPCSWPATVDNIERAREALVAMRLIGGPRPARAWAGIVGEGSRVKRDGQDRAPVDHMEVWKRACIGLRAANYAALVGAQRTRAINLLVETIKALPPAVREEVLIQVERSIEVDSAD